MQKTQTAGKKGIKDVLSLFRGKRGAVRIVAVVFAVGLLVLSVLTFIGVGNEVLIPLSKVMTVVMGVLMIALAAEIVLLALLLGEDPPNFFLYDASRKANLPTSQLSEELVSRRMDAYLSRIAKNKGQLWLPGYLERCNFGAEGQFRTVTAYKMLLDLAEVDSDGGWRCFSAAAPATVQWIADALRDVEPQMMKDVLLIKTKFGGDPARIRACLVRNAPYLKKRMSAYVAANIASFRGMK